MARQPRFVLVGHPQHVIIRGNNREPIFCTEEDYRFYLEKLKQASNKHQCDIHAYVLRANHVHLLTTPWKENGLSKTIQMLGRRYVQYFNYTYQRTGTLWEGRYKASLIDSDNYALEVYRYIELNPVRAKGMADHPGEYPWSSHGHNALGEANDMLVHHPVYESLADTDEGRSQAYRQLFQMKMKPNTLQEIRKATNNAWVLGSPCFKEKIGAMVNRRVNPIRRGGDRRSEKYRGRAGINRV